MKRILLSLVIFAVLWIGCGGVDTEAPTVNITAPTDGSIVSGTVCKWPERYHCSRSGL